MTHEIITGVPDDKLEAFLPIERVRKACLVTNNSHDADLLDYRRAAYDAATKFARASFLPVTVKATFQAPYPTTKNFGIEAGGKLIDLDGVARVFRLPIGPARAIAHVKYLDGGGTPVEDILATSYSLEGGRFVRWAKDFEFKYLEDRASFTLQYEAGLPDDSPDLASVRVAVREIVSAMWDARGGSFKMPTSAANALLKFRTSRTWVPGAQS